MFYQTYENVRFEYKNAPALGIPTPVSFPYMADKVQTGTWLGRNLIQKLAKVEYDATSLVVLLRYGQYGPIERLAYPRTVSGYGGGGTLMYASRS